MPVPLRSADEYLESLRDGREVYYDGQRVADVVVLSDLRAHLRQTAAKTGAKGLSCGVSKLYPPNRLGVSVAPVDRGHRAVPLDAGLQELSKRAAGLEAARAAAPLGTPPAVFQRQLADPDALTAIFQFQDGVWLTYRPGGLAILNTLTSIDRHAPLFLALSRATRWAGPLLFFGDRSSVAIASGFTSMTFTELHETTPEALLAQFANPGAVKAIFLFDNDLNAGQGGYRTFRTSGPSFLNDLELVQPFDVFFVLTDRATSLALREFVLPAE
jgi:hypothetical protein